MNREWLVHFSSLIIFLVVQNLMQLDEIQRKIGKMGTAMQKHINELLEEADKLWRSRFIPLAEERVQFIQKIPEFWVLAVLFIQFYHFS